MEAPEISGAEFVYRALTDAGVDLMVGLPGTQTLPLDRVIADGNEIQYVMARNEMAIPHIAWGNYESGGSVAATLTVPGPGDTNVMHGLKNAQEDCVPILHFSADVDPRDRHKSPIHEIEPETFDTVVKENVAIKRSIELPRAMARALSVARTPPMGPVRIGIPSGILNETQTYDTVSYSPDSTTYDVNSRIEAAVEELADADRPLIYVGGGTRRSPDGPTVVNALSATLGAPVLSSYKGKGVFPEDDERFLGVAGSHLPTPSRQVLNQADVVLALGADFDGVATDHWKLPFGETLIHVNLDTDDVDRAYDATIPVIADVGEAGRTLCDRLQDRSLGRFWDGKAIATRARAAYESHLDKMGLMDDTTPLRTPALLETVRTVTPRDAVVTVDVGGFRLWAMQKFPAFARNRFIAAGSWAGMGVGLPAAIGAKLANPDAPVLSMIGDGGLFMCLSELHTAVEEGLDLVVIVSNNADYGIISKSPEIAEYTSSHQFRWSSPDFATVAEGFGCWSRRVDGVDGLRRAVETAFDRNEPVPKVVSVDVEATEPSAPAASRAIPAMDPSLFDQTSYSDG